MRSTGATPSRSEQYLAASERFSSEAGRRNALVEKHSDMDGGSPPLDPVQGQTEAIETINELNLPEPYKCSPLKRPSSLRSLPALQSCHPDMGIKTALIARPSREKSVAMWRFRRSRTRRFFHPYAKVGDLCLVFSGTCHLNIDLLL
ncbi:unnamed protein product [Strongylus vulgaris]|uniref:Uncharacterized protein n=1 Tax=Strongylus vulgaris TaxID=40348 RepID=A0A3P7LR39_STRVU|nr:unnamed protein product [Strongylus vulgaris]